MEFIGFDGLFNFRNKNGELTFNNGDENIRLIQELRVKGVRHFLDSYDAYVTHTCEDEFYRFHVGDKSFFVLTDAEIEKVGIEHVKERIHFYTPEFLRDVFKITLPISVIKAIQEAGEEAANEACHALIDNWDEALSNAVSCDGYGSVLHSYDNKCDEIHVEYDLYYCAFNILRMD